MAIVSDDEIIPQQEIFTSDTESDPEMMSDDDDDFQPFALLDFGNDVPHADGLLDEDPFLIPIPDQDHLILGHPDGEHVVVPILAPLPLAAFPLEDLPFDDLSDDDVDLFIDGPPDAAQGDGVPAEDVVVVPFFENPIIEDPSDHSVPDSFESVSSSTLHAVGLQRYPTDSDTDTALSAAPTPPHDFEFDLELDFDPNDQPVDAPADPKMLPADPEPIPADPELVPAPEPIPAPDPLPDHDPVPFGMPDVAPLIPDPIPAPADPAAFADQIDPRYAFTSNGWIDDDDDVPPFVEPVTPPHDIPPPRPGEGPSSQQPGHVPLMSATFPHMPQYTSTAHFNSAPPGEPLIWFPPNTMPVSDPYHPSHFIGYTRDELLLSLQLQQEILCHRVMELERIPRPPPCSCPSPFATPPAPLFPYPDFDVRFLTMKQ
ncbi:cell surface glycoprotein 1-like [Helianthus annuus]|uniref:cell surface glycoprotein 1-like n=1 Tax=Helianthus annuus TaxID=4232 RepID=UPI000B908B7C|nr:cell surface glycoprotein 1-like [Helianthus annuus]